MSTVAFKPAPALADTLNNYGVIVELKGPGQPDLSKVAEKYPQPTRGEAMEIKALYDRILDAETYEEQEKLWAVVIESYKEYPLVTSRAYASRGNLRGVQGKIDLAFKDYKKAEEITPDQPTGALSRGSLLLKMGKPNEAVTELERAYELTSDIMPEQKNKVINYMAAALIDSGRYKDAEEYLMKSIDSGSKTYAVYSRTNLAICKIEQGEPEKARQILGPITQPKGSDSVEVADASIIYSLA